MHILVWHQSIKGFSWRIFINSFLQPTKFICTIEYCEEFNNIFVEKESLKN